MPIRLRARRAAAGPSADVERQHSPSSTDDAEAARCARWLERLHDDAWEYMDQNPRTFLENRCCALAATAGRKYRENAGVLKADLRVIVDLIMEGEGAREALGRACAGQDDRLSCGDGLIKKMREVLPWVKDVLVALRSAKSVDGFVGQSFLFQSA